MFLFSCSNKSRTWIQTQELWAIDAQEYKRFGGELSISGDYLVTGAPNDNFKGTLAGAAYVYTRTKKGWEHQSKLTASDGSGYDNFGSSVSISGDFIAIGSPWSSSKTESGGAVYIYHYDDNRWREQSILSPEGNITNDHFGTGVSLDRDRLLISAPGVDMNFGNEGAAYIYLLKEDEWVLEATLSPEDLSFNDEFGNSVHLFGDLAIIGVSSHDENERNSGAAYIFQHNETGWIQTEKLTASDPKIMDYFGEEVAISPKYAVVGVPYKDSSKEQTGAAYIFKHEEEGWREIQKLTLADANEEDYFGNSLALEDNYLFISCPGADTDEMEDVGAVYVFSNIENEWVQTQKIMLNNAEEGDVFGGRLSITNHTAVISSFWKDNKEYSIINAGALYIFELK
ncbi:MAG: FG-GAP repeat protein [Candidatus Marinimicrobia bacterium]|nr:FG-GAP repeat protein [Candidatus Neomarinimicrobiota bacterium]